LKAQPDTKLHIKLSYPPSQVHRYPGWWLQASSLEGCGAGKVIGKGE